MASGSEVFRDHAGLPCFSLSRVCSAPPAVPKVLMTALTGRGGRAGAQDPLVRLGFRVLTAETGAQNWNALRRRYQNE